MTTLVPMPSIYYPDYIAANQADRADNILPGLDKQQHLDTIRQNIRDFKATTGVDKVIVMWTANTERFSSVETGLNDTAEALLASISRSAEEVSPSTIFAVASILEKCSYINGSPQNTCVPVSEYDEDCNDYNYLSVCLSVCLPACLPVCLPVCLSVSLSVCLSVLSLLLFCIWYECCAVSCCFML
jgi:hypothetical protein